MASSSFRVEAERWLTIAEKLLAARDLHGAKTFAIRARESDPRLYEFSDQIIAVVDTLLAGELRINNCPDYYAILQLDRFTQSMELVATQYRKVALLLNPNRNRLSYAERAFELVSEAWMVFSNPAKKAMYDRELEMSQLVQLGQLGQLGQQHFQHHPESQGAQTPVKRSARIGRDGRIVMEDEEDPVAQSFVPEPTRPILVEPTRPVINIEWNKPAAQPNVPEPAQSAAKQTYTETPNNRQGSQQTTPVESIRSATQSTPSEPKVLSFWTSCPYCYNLYEYPQGYEGCALRCQNCKRAFHAVVLSSPPLTGKSEYFCSWSYFPMGFAGAGKGNSGGDWSPFTAMFATPLQDGGKVAAKGKVIYKDDMYMEVSDESDESDSDEEWGQNKKKAKSSKGRGTPSKNVKKSQNERGKKGNNKNVGGGGNGHEEAGGKGPGSSGKKKVPKDLGKLDLNVMFSNEVEEAVPGASGGHGPRHGTEEDNIEGIGFFEGLDEFLSSLPILSVVGDDKAKAT